MRIGGYELMRYSRRNEQGGMNGEGYIDALRQLSAMVGSKARWAVTGGLAIPLSTGTFTRTHSDIDVAVPAEDFPAFSRSLESEGYVLGRKCASAKISPSVCAEVYERMRPEDVVSCRARKVKLIDSSREGILRTIHAFPYELEGTRLSYFDPDVSLHVDGEFMREVELGEASLPVVGLKYVRMLKAMMPPHQKHVSDLELLARLGVRG